MKFQTAKITMGTVLLLVLAQAALAGENSVVDTGTTAWMLTSTALVLLMIPGLAMFYGGLVRTKNVLGTMMHSFVAMAVIGILWVVCGYALTFGKSVLGGFVGWESDYFLLKGIDDVITDGVPEYVLAMFQGKFAIITPALISGALAERVYFRGYVFFIALWFLLVYCPLCHWIWAVDGWLFNAGAAGVIDLAGGLVIHVSAGISALVVALLLCFFIRDSWMMDAAGAAGGTWTVWNQLGIQLVGMGATIAIAAIGTTIIYFIVEKTIGFRLDEEKEIIGLDQSLHSEHGYGLASSDRYV